MRKRRVVGKIYGMKYSRKGHKDRNRHKNRIKRSGQARLLYVKNINRNIPTTWRWAREDIQSTDYCNTYKNSRRTILIPQLHFDGVKTSLPARPEYDGGARIRFSWCKLRSPPSDASGTESTVPGWKVLQTLYLPTWLHPARYKYPGETGELCQRVYTGMLCFQQDVQFGQ